MRVLIVANREPDPQGPADAKIASQAAVSLSNCGAAIDVEHATVTPRWTQAQGLMRAVITGDPFQIGLTASREFSERVRTVIEANSYDVIIAVHARATAHIPRRHRRRTLALVVDVYGRSYATYRGRVPLPLDLIYRSEARRMTVLEKRLVQDFGAVAVVSPADATYLRLAAGERGAVVHLPYAVDLRHFQARTGVAQPEQLIFVFSGRLSFLPNAHAARRLIGRIWPALRSRWPGAELRVVGARPANSLVDLARREGVNLLADVTDIRPHLAAATAALAPVQLGCGVQTKVLEAMAVGVPVVCTPSANEGVGATPEEEVLLAETPADYVRQLERTLDDGEATTRRASAARRLVEHRHSPTVFTARLLEVCRSLAQPH